MSAPWVPYRAPASRPSALIADFRDTCSHAQEYHSNPKLYTSLSMLPDMLVCYTNPAPMPRRVPLTTLPRPLLVIYRICLEHHLQDYLHLLLGLHFVSHAERLQTHSRSES
jgi:hypothetical protein